MHRYGKYCSVAGDHNVGILCDWNNIIQRFHT